MVVLLNYFATRVRGKLNRLLSFIIMSEVKQSGAVAQLGARLNGIQKVRGSNPLSSIHFSMTLNDSGAWPGTLRVLVSPSSL